EDLSPATANNVANYELRSAGADNTLGTTDDQLYTVTGTGYASGLSATYRVSDGPLQPGIYRFTVKTGVKDRAGNSLANPFVRNFTLTPASPFIIENRSNDSFGTATSLSPTPSTTSDGTFSPGSSIATG